MAYGTQPDDVDLTVRKTRYSITSQQQLTAELDKVRAHGVVASRVTASRWWPGQCGVSRVSAPDSTCQTVACSRRGRETSSAGVVLDTA